MGSLESGVARARRPLMGAGTDFSGVQRREAGFEVAALSAGWGPRDDSAFRRRSEDAAPEDVSGAGSDSGEAELPPRPRPRWPPRER